MGCQGTGQGGRGCSSGQGHGDDAHTQAISGGFHDHFTGVLGQGKRAYGTDTYRKDRAFAQVLNSPHAFRGNVHHDLQSPHGIGTQKNMFAGIG